MKSYNSINVGIFNPLTLRLDWPIAYAFQLSEDLIPGQWTQNAFACQSFSTAQQSVWYILYNCNYSSQGIVKTQSFHFRQCLLPQGGNNKHADILRQPLALTIAVPRCIGS